MKINTAHVYIDKQDRLVIKKTYIEKNGDLKVDKQIIDKTYDRRTT